MKTVWTLFLVLLSIVLTLGFSVNTNAQVSLNVKPLILSDQITLDGHDITGLFGINPRYGAVEVRAAWTQPQAGIEFSYTGRSRRNIDVTGAPKGFVFRGVEFAPQDGKEFLTLSGSFLSNTFDARILSMSRWFAPTVRLNWADWSLSVAGKPKQGEYTTVYDRYQSWGLGLGGTAGYRFGDLWIEGMGIIYTNRNGYDGRVLALYEVRHWMFGVGYLVERNVVNSLDVSAQGPFMQVGVRF